MGRVCPHCGTKSSFATLCPEARIECKDKNGYHYIECCNECGGIIYSIWNVDILAGIQKSTVSGATSYKPTPRPEPMMIFSYPFVSMKPPIKISGSFEKSFTEGVKCLNVGAPFAAVTMFRKCLQIIVEDKGGKGDQLYKQIESLHISGTLTSTLKSISTVIREVGNDGAHSNKFEPSLDDARDIFDFLLLLIDYLYTLPERANKLSIRRNLSLKPKSSTKKD